MSHECTTCGQTFQDGSKEMLSGCPECGGNKFQFHPGGTDESDVTATTHQSDPPPEPAEPSVESGTSSFSFGGQRSDVEESTTDGDSGQTDDGTTVTAEHREDTAQASARSEVVEPDELALAEEFSEPAVTQQSSETADNTDTETSSQGDAESTDHPDLSELREELNDQFESIKIHAPGEYELNLMELYDREEHIIALQEDGRYVIDVPGSWRGEDPE